ncbi:MAG: hypothetical protein ICV55_13065 [Coleofasciculus sp. C3-bin4]|nr:hypothetical protein [Coleofasciculus sp. C3-bin4]
MPSRSFVNWLDIWWFSTDIWLDIARVPTALGIGMRRFTAGWMNQESPP